MDSSINDNKKHILKLAHLFFQNGQWDKALIEYKKIMDLDPTDTNALQALGDIYFKKDSFQQAFDFYNKAASGFLKTVQTNKAIAAYKKILELDSSKLNDDAKTQTNYALGYVKIDETLAENKIEPAIELMGRILKFRPEDPFVKILLMTLDVKIKQMAQSVQTYQTLGDAFFNSNMFEKAGEMFTKVTELDPQNLAVHMHLAQVYLKQGAFSEAKKEYLNLAEQSLAKGNLDQAEDLAQKAIELKSVEARYISGLVNFKRQKYETAISEFEILLRFKTNHLGALLHLGKSFDLLGRLEKARSTFHKALNTDNDNPEVQEAWIEFCLRSKEEEIALPNLKIVLDKSIKDNNPEYIARFSKLMLRLEPDNFAVLTQLIEALEKLGDNKETADALHKLAMLHEKKRQFSDAVQCLEKALVLSPSNYQLLEKALLAMRQKEIKSNGPSFLLNSNEKPMVLESSDFWDGQQIRKEKTPNLFVNPHILSAPEPLNIQVSQTVEINPSEIPIQSPALSHQVPLNNLEVPLALASICIQRGYLKAAIEVYQQILETHPDSEAVRKNLAEVSGLYLKKLTGPK